MYVLDDPKFVAMKLYVLVDQSAAEEGNPGMILVQMFQEATKEMNQVTLSP